MFWFTNRGAITAAAVISEGWAAYMAFPAASDKLGELSGFVFTALIAGAIIYTWMAFFDAKSIRHKLLPLAVATLVLIPLSVVSIHHSANLPEQKKSTEKRLSDQDAIDVKNAKAEKEYSDKISSLDEMWKDQEKSRIAALAQINAEIKTTKKKDQPEIYQQLLDKQTFLAGATPVPTYPEKPIKEQLPPVAQPPLVSDLSFLQSVVFSLLTPVFLWLKTKLPPVKKTEGSVRPSVRGLYAAPSTSVRFSGEQTTVQTPTENAKNSEPETDQYSDEFESRSVPCDVQYGITLGIIQQHFGESERQARARRATAVSAGFVVKVGSKYIYPKNTAATRKQKPKPKAQVVQLKRVK